MGGVLKPCMGRNGGAESEGWWEGSRVNHHYSRLKIFAPERLTIPVPVIQGREETIKVTIHQKPLSKNHPYLVSVTASALS